MLAHTQFGQLARVQDGNSPVRFVGQYVAIGTVIYARPGDSLLRPVRSVVDMRDDSSPLLADHPHPETAYPTDEETGGL